MTTTSESVHNFLRYRAIYRFSTIEHTECITRESGDKGDGRGKDKTAGNRDIRRSVEGRGKGRGTWGIQDGHYRDFQEGK